MVKIVFELGDEWTVYDPDDWRRALAVASNLLEMQRELPERWRLRIEAGPGPSAKWPSVN